MYLVVSGYVGINICEIVSFWMKSRENRIKVITAANQRKEWCDLSRQITKGIKKNQSNCGILWTLNWKLLKQFSE